MLDDLDVTRIDRSNVVAFSALVEKVHELQNDQDVPPYDRDWLSRYATDLYVHDFRSIVTQRYGRLPENPSFLWILRKHGTHIALWRESAQDILNGVKNYFDGRAKIFFWDGQLCELTEVDFNSAMDLVPYLSSFMEANDGSQ